VHGNGLRGAVLAGGLTCLALLGGAAAGGDAGLAAACGIVAGLGWIIYFSAERIVLSALRARPVGEVERPELYRIVRELCTDARLPVPRLFVSPAMQPNALTVGTTARSAAVCCTEGLLRALSPEELRGVLGHELAHVSRRDILVSSASAGLAAVITSAASVGWLLRGRGGDTRDPGLVEELLLLVFGPLAALVIQLAVPSSREYRADTTGALLAGDPLALASALRKIDSGAAMLPLAPSGPLASVGHLMIAHPFPCDGLSRLFITHPPTGERVRRLEALAGYPR